MRYEVEVAGKTVTVEVSVSGASLGVRLDGREVRAEAMWVGAREVSLLVDGKSYDIELHPAEGDSVVVAVAGSRLRVDLGATRAAAGRRSTASGDAVVRAPMPGRVVAVLVAPGETVAAGQGVVVVEAMKMENELQSPAAGTVRAVHVRGGQVVESGAALIEVAALGDAG